MAAKSATLHMLCGKIASGKSTLAKRLSEEEGAVLLVEDDWLSALYGDEMKTLSDFVRCSAKLRGVMGAHITSLLNRGVSVVLDFQANTVESRNWMRGLLQHSGASHILHLLDVPDDACITRMHERNARGDHPFAATEEQFHQISRHFAAPAAGEGFNIVRHTAKE